MPNDFSVPHLNGSYVVGNWTESNLLGARKLTDWFLVLVSKGEISLPGFEDVEFAGESLLDYFHDNADAIVKSNTPLIGVASLGPAIALVVILTAILVAICCCCCCDRSNQQGKKSSDGCKSLVLEVLILAFGALATFGIAWYFFSAIKFGSELDSLPERIDGLAGDVDLFVSNTVGELEHLSGKNLEEFSDMFDDEISKARDEFNGTIFYIKDGIHLDKFIELLGFFNRTAFEFEHKVKGEIRDGIAKMDKRFKDIAEDLKSVRKNGCERAGNLLDGPTCVLITSAIDGANVLDETLDALDKLEVKEDDLKALKEVSELVGDAESALADFSEDFDNQYVGEFRTKLDEMKQNVRTEFGKVVREARQVNVSAKVDEATGAIRDEYFNSASVAANVTMLSIGSIVCLFVLFFFLGSIIGCCCGGRKNATGSCCLATGIALFVTLGALFWILLSAFFLIGGLSELIVCKSLDGESSLSDKLDAELDRLLHNNLDGEYPAFKNVTFSVFDTIDQCKSGDGIYGVFHLENVYDVSQLKDWKETYGVDGSVQEVLEKVEGKLDEVIDDTRINDGQKQTFGNVAGQFDRLSSDVIESVGSLTLDSVIPDGLIESLAAHADEDLKPVVEGLQEAVDAAKVAATELRENVKNYSTEALEFNGKNISELVDYVLELSENATDYMDVEGRKQIMDVTNATLKSALALGDSFVRFCVARTNEGIGKCRPLYKIYEGARITTCSNFVDPINGLWLGLGVALVSLLFCSALGCCLRNVFRSRALPQPAYDPSKMSKP